MNALRSIPQVADELDISPWTLYGYVRKGLLPTVEVGNGRVALNERTIRLLRAILQAEGFEGVRRGLLADEAA